MTGRVVNKMEAENGQSGAGVTGDSGPLIDNTKKSVKKIFRARKTMTASCRQQMAALNKIKTSSKQNAAGEPCVFFPKQPIEHSDFVCKTNYLAQESGFSKLNKSPECENSGLIANGVKVSIEMSHANSGINIGCSYNETFSQWSPSENNDKVVSPCSRSPDHVQRSEESFVAEKPTAELQPEVYQKPNNFLPVSESIDQDCSESPTKAGFVHVMATNSSPQSISQAIAPISKALGEPLDDRVVIKRSILDLATVINSAQSMDRAVVMASPTNSKDGLSDPSCIGDSPAPKDFKLNLSEDSSCEDILTKWSPSAGVEKRKRPCSECDEHDCNKRTKASDKDWPGNRAIMEQIQNLIDSRIQSFFKEVFDQRMDELIKRINIIQSNGNHQEEISSCIKKVNKLEKRVKSALRFQKIFARPRRGLTGSNKKGNVKITHQNVSNLGAQSAIVAPACTEKSQSEKSNPNNCIIVSDSDSEQQISSREAVFPSDADDCSKTPKIEDDLAFHKNVESSQQKQAASKEEKIKRALIDLAEEKGRKKNIDLGGNQSSTSQDFPAMMDLKPKVGKSPLPKPLERDGANTVALPPVNTTDELNVKPAVSELIKTENLPNPVDYLLTSPDLASEMHKTLPPQKPVLRLTQVRNPKGIALSWDITNIDPNCAPVKSYCLYVHQNNPQNPKVVWKKIPEILALPLPMACTLTQFVDGIEYSFLLRAKDIYGRFGPLCDIQSTTLLPSPSSLG